MLCDGATEFETARPGYEGKLFSAFVPVGFDIFLCKSRFVIINEYNDIIF